MRAPWLLRISAAAIVPTTLLSPIELRACPTHDVSNSASSALARGGPGPVDDNLGYRWKSTATPDGYNVTLDAPKNTLRYIGTTPMVPIKNELDFAITGPSKLNFFKASNPDPMSPAPLEYFMYRLKFTNKTGTDWKGFNFTIIDNNNTDYPGQGQNGTVIHPDRAHFHVNSLKEAQLGFTTIDTERIVRNANGVLETDNPGLDTDGGVYKIKMTGGFLVRNNATWEPTKFVPLQNQPNSADLDASSLLQFHVRIGAAFNASFSVLLEPILVPEPTTAAFASLAPILLLGRRRRRSFSARRSDALHQDELSSTTR